MLYSIISKRPGHCAFLAISSDSKGLYTIDHRVYTAHNNGTSSTPKTNLMIIIHNNIMYVLRIHHGP